MALVLYENITPQIGLITLNDPESLNAMGERMADEFSAVSTGLKGNRALRSIILTGAGRAFSAGGDLEMLERKTTLGAEENRVLMLKFYHSFLDLLQLNVPLIAAINGHAIGAGLCLASACDIRIAAEKSKLGFTFVRLGLHPGMGATWFLPRVVGSAAATELVITGRVIEVEEALRIGLVSRIVPAAEAVPAARKIAEEIAECGPSAVSQVVKNMREPPAALQTALEREAQAQSANYAGAEFKEGIRAAREKRKPVWP